MTATQRIFVFVDRLPSAFLPTLHLLRRRMCLSRELSDDVVRARGYADRRYKNSDLSLSFEANYIDFTLHGLATWWYRTGRRERELPFVEGKRHGVARTWHSHDDSHDDEERLSYVVPYVDDRKHGVERWFFSNGSVMALFHYCYGEMID